MSAGLRRKDHFDELLGAQNPNIALPSYIASQIVDSVYFTRFLGNDLSEAHDAVEEKNDEARVVERVAQQQNAPLAELRALVESMRPPPDMRPSEGQAAHEARANQHTMMAQLEAQRVGLAATPRGHGARGAAVALAAARPDAIGPGRAAPDDAAQIQAQLHRTPRVLQRERARGGAARSVAALRKPGV